MSTFFCSIWNLLLHGTMKGFQSNEGLQSLRFHFGSDVKAHLLDALSNLSRKHKAHTHMR